ncbi:molybdopterin molybdotransferase MoeA [Desulfoprunum benzoelyticum]|uniref:Molybdopterin molybdenumtransferase n=1 Tax=Desulfoprunum benzoelyticum TaxID=1506996 RepID=A0A840UWD1_9BACT|nr:molybdopterin molybdotransferase MoeA [Desulfoprunum benzoelyticum]MBB5347008.1 molybdopterin molybdotransferase [Desulfoprunum benzoelyticum]MBM9531624.1 molybdopterin molybdotransferase MoeA [Desulfoprunum benzoelyticum]
MSLFPHVDELIAETIIPLSGEICPVVASPGRVASRPLLARVPQPGYDQATRDGFAVGAGGDNVVDGRRFRIDGEAPAGDIQRRVLAAGQACRIMTGGMVPDGAERVVPQEDCVVDGGMVLVSARGLARKKTFIDRQGSQVAVGELLVDQGSILQTEDSALLASCGHTEIEVYRRPRVGFFCTGSELVESAAQLVPGLKVSSNRYLLEGLIRQFLAEPVNLGVVPDTAGALDEILAKIETASLDAVISTGGMGPGKYDLLEDAFRRAGGKVVSRALAMRPGASTLVGRLGRTVFFGLPGPPGAVRTLMNELVGPALLQLQGVADYAPVTLSARLQQRVEIRTREVLQIKPGALNMTAKGLEVRLAGRLEPPTCFILFPPGCGVLEPATEVEVHLAWSPEVARLFRG